VAEQQNMDEAVWADAMSVSIQNAQAGSAMSRMLWALGSSASFGPDVSDKQAVWAAFVDWEKFLLDGSQEIINRVRSYIWIKCGPIEQ
jgi:hypothetical protein